MTRSVDQFLLEPESNTLMIVPIFSDVMPFENTIDQIDWSMASFISRLRTTGIFNANDDEFVLLPYRYPSGTKHILLVGMGARTASIKLNPSKVAKHIHSRIQRLGYKRLYFADALFNEADTDTATKMKADFVTFFKEWETTWIA